MLISSVKAYEYGSVSVVAPLLTLSMITNTIYEYIFDKNKKTERERKANPVKENLIAVLAETLAKQDNLINIKVTKI